MSGVAVIISRLLGNSSLLAAVPAASIYAGDVSQGVALPAISVRTISGVPFNFVRNGSRLTVTERVQVTVLVKRASYGSLKTILALVRGACPGARGTINGISVIDIVPDFLGPELDGDVSVEMVSQSWDFMVRWSG